MTIVHETATGEFTQLSGRSFAYSIEGEMFVISTASLRLWSDDDLAEKDLYRPAPIEPPPEGYRHTGPTRYERIDGVVRAVRDVEPIPPPPPTRRIVLKRVIVQRLIEDGFAEAAETALSAAPVELRLLWNNLNDGPFSDDPDTVAWITQIGADPERILAPHEEDILVPVEPAS